MYDQLEHDFLAHYGSLASFSVVDFRPHFDGHLLNLAVLTSERSSKDSTIDTALRLFTDIMNLLFEQRHQLYAHDKCQVVVGWSESVKKTNRQIIKGVIEVQHMAYIDSPLNEQKWHELGGKGLFMPGWDANVSFQHAPPGGTPEAGRP